MPRTRYVGLQSRIHEVNLSAPARLDPVIEDVVIVDRERGTLDDQPRAAAEQNIAIDDEVVQHGQRGRPAEHDVPVELAWFVDEIDVGIEGDGAGGHRSCVVWASARGAVKVAMNTTCTATSQDTVLAPRVDRREERIAGIIIYLAWSTAPRESAQVRALAYHNRSAPPTLSMPARLKALMERTKSPPDPSNHVIVCPLVAIRAKIALGILASYIARRALDPRSTQHDEEVSVAKSRRHRMVVGIRVFTLSLLIIAPPASALAEPIIFAVSGSTSVVIWDNSGPPDFPFCNGIAKVSRSSMPILCLRFHPA